MQWATLGNATDRYCNETYGYFFAGKFLVDKPKMFGGLIKNRQGLPYRVGSAHYSSVRKPWWCWVRLAEIPTNPLHMFTVLNDAKWTTPYFSIKKQVLHNFQIVFYPKGKYFFKSLKHIKTTFFDIFESRSHAPALRWVSGSQGGLHLGVSGAEALRCRMLW